MQKQIIHLTRKDCYKKYTFLFNNLGNILNFIRLALPAATISGIKVDNNQKKKASSFPQPLKYNVIKGELREASAKYFALASLLEKKPE